MQSSCSQASKSWPATLSMCEYLKNYHILLSMINNWYGKVNGQCELRGWEIFIDHILPHLTTAFQMVDGGYC